MDRSLEGINNYFDNINTPWGKMFYEIIFRQLGDIKDKRILDFGSGFGVTADFLAKHNDVTAIEPNELMIERRYKSSDYKQIVGGTEKLRELPDGIFDIAVCHNVLEYVADRREVMMQFVRVLKPNGYISIVKHNRNGKIMQKAVREYKPEEVKTLLGQGNAVSASFGIINTYENSDLLEYSEGALEIKKCQGIRTFYALQDNDIKYEENWSRNMLELELSVCDIDDFCKISFFNHVILTKKGELQ